MRWHVEVSSVGNAERESFTVEAESWQNALEQTRTLRQDPGGIRGLSIESIDDGCRAFDAATRVRYEIRRERASSRPALSRAIMYQKAQEPTAQAPFTYREVVFLVPAGTPEREAERFLRQQLDEVQTSLADARRGRFVRLAAFDRLFHGKPTIAPLAVLTWKDWKGDPDVAFPRRRSVPEIPPPPPAARAEVPPLQLDPEEPTRPVSSKRKSGRPEPSPESGPKSGPKSNPTSGPVVEVVATEAVGEKEPLVADARAEMSLSEPLLMVVPPELMPPSRPPSRPPSSNPPPKTPSSNPPPPRASSGRQKAAPVSASFPDDAPRTVPAMRPRLKAEELISAFFEAMHDLHFLRDAVEGADFCLSLALEKIPAQAGLVHLYDIDTRSFVIVATRGTSADPLLLKRLPENDPVLAVAMRRRRAVVHRDASQEGVASLERYARVGGAQSLVAAPVMQAGRFLGALELLNPIDGAPFTEAEGHALTYVGEQLAEFVAPRGVVTDPERIRAVASLRARSG